MTGIRVFIYGSLLPGHYNHYVVSAFIKCCAQGEIRGRLVDYGPYPAAVRDEASIGRTIQGLWISVDRKGLAAMDAIEDFIGIEEQNDYERIWTKDERDASLSGWVYVWEDSRGCPDIPDSYWPDYIARKTGV